MKLHNSTTLPHRSFSILCCGNGDHMHVELRARCLCELVLNIRHYLTPEIISTLSLEGLPTVSVLPGASASYNAVASQCSKDIASICMLS